MKNRIWTVLVAALTAVILTACTQADSGNSASVGNSSSTGSGTIAGSGENGTGTSGSGDTQGSSVGLGTDSLDSAGAAPTASGTVSGDTASGENTAPAANVSVEDDEEKETASSVSEENFSDEQFDAMNEDETDGDVGDDGWTGTYLGESGENLTISIVDASSISFSFATSGISGTAELNGSQAVYHGDDQHVVVFDYAGTDIAVSVLSEEDFDASESPLNGVYVRQ